MKSQVRVRSSGSPPAVTPPVTRRRSVVQQVGSASGCRWPVTASGTCRTGWTSSPNTRTPPHTRTGLPVTRYAALPADLHAPPAPPPPDCPLFSPPSQLPTHTVTSSRHSDARGGSSAYHTLPHLSSYESVTPTWGPLEPPSTPKPWSLSCLRPAPPLRPSAALCFKEVLS